jgi:uncharacterized membrane protein HdeD (DUF308 family)
MTANPEATVSDPTDLVYGEVKQNWGWMLALGILFILLGTIGLGYTFSLTIASVFFFGILLLVGGGMQLVHTFKCQGWKCRIWHVLLALLYILVGADIMARPLVASVVLTLLLAGGITALGIVRIVMAFQIRGTKNWGWLLFSGVISVLLGVMIATRWPVSGLWVIGLFVAIEMIMHGWSYIFLAMAARSAASTLPAETPAPAT